MDRLARSLEDMLRLVREMDEQGIWPYQAGGSLGEGKSHVYKGGK